MEPFGADSALYVTGLVCLGSHLIGVLLFKRILPDGACPSLMTLERNHMPHALVRARHHSDSMRWRRQVESAKRGTLSTRRGSHDQIAAKPSRHAVPPTVCREGLAEMWIRAQERGGRPPRDMRACVAKVNLL